MQTGIGRHWSLPAWGSKPASCPIVGSCCERSRGLSSSHLLEIGLRRCVRRDQEPCKWTCRAMVSLAGKVKACSFIAKSSGESFPLPLCAKPRARQSQPPPAAPGRQQTGEGASFTAETHSQTECCVISHILWALSSGRPEVPMEAKGSLSLTTQQTSLGPWAQRDRLCCHLK